MDALIITVFVISAITTLYILITTITQCSRLHLVCLFASIFLTFGSLIELNFFFPSQPEILETMSMIITTLTSILSCYTLLLIGTNFYHRFNLMKTLFLFAPVIATFLELSATIYNVVLMIITNNPDPYDLILQVGTYIATLAAVLSLIYATVPLFNIRKRVELVPERTAISIIRLFTVLAFFLVHVIFIFVQTMRGMFQNPVWCAVDHLILDGFFVVGLMPSPRAIVKKIKKQMLGVEEFDIGGDVRISKVKEIMMPRSIGWNDLESGEAPVMEVLEENEQQRVKLADNEQNTEIFRVEREGSAGSSASFTSINVILPEN